jgi:hypothetical protein
VRADSVAIEQLASEESWRTCVRRVVAARCSMTTCMCLYAREAHREVLEDDMQIRVVSSGLASNGTARIHVLPHKMGRRSLARTTAGSGSRRSACFGAGP